MKRTDLKPSKGVAVFLLPLFLVWLFAPAPTQGITLAQILKIIKTIKDTYVKHIGPNMDKINEYQERANELQSVILYPKTLMTDTVQFANQLKGFSREMVEAEQLVDLASANLPETQELENAMRSPYSGGFEALEAAYEKVFGGLPSEAAGSEEEGEGEGEGEGEVEGESAGNPEDAPGHVAGMIDSTQATAVTVLKTLQLMGKAREELVKVAEEAEETTSDTTFAPGSAPFLNATALVASLQSQILIQKIIAAQLRQEASQLALSNGMRKRGVAGVETMSERIRSLLKGNEEGDE